MQHRAVHRAGPVVGLLGFAWLLLGALGVALIGAVAAGAPTPQPAELPREYVDTIHVPPTGRVIRVPYGGDLQGALNAARLGDVIDLEAGATYTGPFFLPRKEGSGWLLVRTDSRDARFEADASRRVDPSMAPLMARLVAATGAVLVLAPGAHHYRFVGIEVRPSPGVFLYSLVGPGVDPRTEADQPHHLIFDRCYLHGDPARGTRRGIALNGRHIAVIHSYFSDFKEDGGDSQALAGWNGSGPFKIVDNYLEGAAENILFGGADPAIFGLIPADIEIRGNTISKNPRWSARDAAYDGSRWTMKTLFQLKNARRVLVEANVFEDFDGFAMVITPRNQSGTAPWSTVEDVTLRYNWIRRVRSVLNVSGYDEYRPSQPTRRITVEHTVAESLYDTGEPNPKTILIIHGPDDVWIRQNTLLTTPGLGSSFLFLANAVRKKGSAFAFTDNIVQVGTYGLIADNPPLGTSSDTLLSGHYRAWIFTGNVLVDPRGVQARIYPRGQHWALSLSAVGFVDVSRWDFGLTLQSRYRGTGAGGGNPGANVGAIREALARHMSVPSPLGDVRR